MSSVFVFIQIPANPAKTHFLPVRLSRLEGVELTQILKNFANSPPGRLRFRKDQNPSLAGHHSAEGREDVQWGFPRDSRLRALAGPALLRPGALALHCALDRRLGHPEELLCLPEREPAAPNCLCGRAEPPPALPGRPDLVTLPDHVGVENSSSPPRASPDALGDELAEGQRSVEEERDRLPGAV